MLQISLGFGLTANAVDCDAGKSLMKILSRTRHLPIAENCAQIISILERNHWNLSISAVAHLGTTQHDDVTDIRADVAGRRCEMWKSNIYDTFQHNFWPSAKVNYKFSSGNIFARVRRFHSLFAFGFMCVPFGKFNLIFIFLARAVGFPMNFWESARGLCHSHISWVMDSGLKQGAASCVVNFYRQSR